MRYFTRICPCGTVRSWAGGVGSSVWLKSWVSTGIRHAWVSTTFVHGHGWSGSWSQGNIITEYHMLWRFWDGF